MTTATKGRALRFRELVGLTLQVRGITVSQRPERPHRLSDRLADDQPESDLLTRRWGVQTVTETTRDLSGQLDRATSRARRDGRDFAAVVWHRPGRAAGESYVLMSLDGLSEVIAELERPS